MQKVYGEKNPDGYFWLTKRKESAGSSSPSYTSPRLHLLQKIIFLLKMRLTKVSRFAPVVSYLDYEEAML